MQGIVSALNDPDHAALRPDACLFDHRRGTVTPIEFTVSHDPRIPTAVKNKHAKYDPALKGAAPAPPAHTIRPLAVVAIGAWGSIHPSAVNSLARLGIPPDAITPLLRNAVKIIARHATAIARVRFASARRGMPTPS